MDSEKFSNLRQDRFLRMPLFYVLVAFLCSMQVTAQEYKISEKRAKSRIKSLIHSNQEPHYRANRARRHVITSLSERGVKRPFQDNLERRDEKIEIKKIQKLLSELDDLYKKIIVKVSKINEQDIFVDTTLDDLYSFLTGTKDCEEIVQLIEDDIKIKLSSTEIDLFRSSHSLSLVEAIRLLWREKIIDNEKTRALLMKHSRMSSDEIVKLLELGALRTSSGYFIQMRTGTRYGDPISLFEEFHAFASSLNESFGEESGSKAVFADYLLRDVLPNDLMTFCKDHNSCSKDILSDARVISEIRRHFVFLSRINLPMSLGAKSLDFPSRALISNGPIDTHASVWTPADLHAVLLKNDYFIGAYSFLPTSAPLAATYWGSYDWSAAAMGWWMSYTDKYGSGSAYPIDFPSGSSWSDSAPGSVVLGEAIGTVKGGHDVYYKGLYPIDGRFVDIRGLHKIEIVDRKEFSLERGVALNPAFRADEKFTVNRIYRIHEDFGNAQRVLQQSDFPEALFQISKKIKESKLPSFDHPERLKVGDEYIETKIGRLSGSFLMGLQTKISAKAMHWEATVDLSGEFKLAMRKLPSEKYEVSIEPQRVYEMGIFVTILNAIQNDIIDTVSLAPKQAFIFDFNIPEAQIAYRNLIDHGIMPSTAEDIPVYAHDRGAEYLLTEFRAHNEILKKQGIVRSYLEKIDLNSDQEPSSLNSHLLSALLDLAKIVDKGIRPTQQKLILNFSGPDQEFMLSKAKSLATNGLIAIRRNTSVDHKSVEVSGSFYQDLYMTHSRVHSVDESSGEAANKWQFGSLVVDAQIEANGAKSGTENEIVESINRYFSTFMNPYTLIKSRFPRTINLRRTFLLKDLEQLSHPKTKDRIEMSSHITLVSQDSLSSLIQSLKNSHPDLQAIKVQEFIRSQPGLSGFAAIHQLLGAKPEDLQVRSHGHYNNAIDQAKRFIAKYSAGDDRGLLTGKLLAKHGFRQKKAIKKFYDAALSHLRQMDSQLRYLHADPYIVDDKSYINRIYGDNRVKELVKNGLRQDKNNLKILLSSTRKKIIDILNLELQGYTEKEREIIYEMAGQKRLPVDDIVAILLNKYEYSAFSPNRSKSHLQKRYQRAREMIKKIDKEIKQLEKDKVMHNMDREYVERRIGELQILREKVLSLVCLNHLLPDAKVRMQRKVGKFYFREKAKAPKLTEIKVDRIAPSHESSQDEENSSRMKNSSSSSSSNLVSFEMDMDS